MKPYLLIALGLLMSSAHAADLAGTYTLKARGGQLVTRVKVSGQTLRGVIEIPNGSPIQLNGTTRDNRAEGTATSAHGNGQFHAQVVGDTLELIISQDAGPNQPAVALPLQFQRAQ